MKGLLKSKGNFNIVEGVLSELLSDFCSTDYNSYVYPENNNIGIILRNYFWTPKFYVDILKNVGFKNIKNELPKVTKLTLERVDYL